MNIDLYTILLAFIEGFALIISPCILPILPIILAGFSLALKKGHWVLFSVLLLASR